jgi:hypothetical protein
MDSTDQTAPRDSVIIYDVLERETHGFEAQTAPRDSEIINEVV